MNKKIIIIIAIIILGGIGLYSSFWIRYYFAMEKSNEDDKIANCKEQTEEHFSGKIRGVERFEYDESMKNHFISLDIVPDSGINITYQFYYDNAKDKLRFIEKGDRVTKIKNTNLFTVIKSNGDHKKFIIPNCE